MKRLDLGAFVVTSEIPRRRRPLPAFREALLANNARGSQTDFINPPLPFGEIQVES